MKELSHTQVPFLNPEKSLACIHCGLCLSSCPTYLETGNENDSPRGRIYLMRALEDRRLPLSPTAVRHLDLCLGCRACEAVCPSGVQYGELLEATRHHIEENYRRPLLQRLLRKVAIEQIFPFPRRLRWILWPAKVVKRLRIEPWLPRSIREALALIPRGIESISLAPMSAAAEQPARGRVGFIAGCVMRVMFGRTNASSVSLLNRIGYDVLTPAEQGCCGALYAHGGNLEAARACARRNIEAFEKLSLEAIIINAAGCGSTLKEYHQLLRDDADWRERAQAFSERVHDLTEWLVKSETASNLGAQPDRGDEGPVVQVTYHDACHLAHAQRVTQAPRKLLRAVPGINLIDLPESDVCCGSAGSYNLTEPAMAARLQERKVKNILASGAQIVVTTNPGCVLQIQAGLRAAGAGHVRVMHLADFLEEQLERGVCSLPQPLIHG